MRPSTGSARGISTSNAASGARHPRSAAYCTRYADRPAWDGALSEGIGDFLHATSIFRDNTRRNYSVIHMQEGFSPRARVIGITPSAVQRGMRYGWTRTPRIHWIWPSAPIAALKSADEYPCATPSAWTADILSPPPALNDCASGPKSRHAISRNVKRPGSRLSQ
ncbi:hypothetical protein SMALB_7668 [Streptomyces malaysiensis]|uniref:Uncharacterized protein n=1 Tax=Streptomyces malaysiensis TaxID=92644 RepID=A0A7X5XAE6_STRMQ|nr:hypothetical protein [Streptomyces malaysiensis]